ncbi:MAG: hypothetical protein KGP28_03900 [Bdellovibrionales bacterium]|nr:hypothetical protein [Bdellovibrionales bacterium]
MKKTLMMMAGGILLNACGGAPVREVTIEAPRFKVTDAAPGGREAWLDSPNFYAKKEGLDVESYFFYTGDSQSADKRMACDKASADALDDIAKQVSTFVDSAIARATTDSTGSDSNGSSVVSASQTESSKLSSQLSKTLVSGVEKSKQYWEQRDYSETGGAKSVFYCWVLAKVSKKQVDDLILKAQNFRFKNDPSLRAKSEGKLQDIEKQFDRYMESR